MIDLSPSQQALVKNILHKFVGDTEIWGFGSRVKGNSTQSSDLDIAIMPESPIPMKTMFQIKDELEFSELPFRVDVVDWQRLSPEFQTQIQACYHPI